MGMVKSVVEDMRSSNNGGSGDNRGNGQSNLASLDILESLHECSLSFSHIRGISKISSGDGCGGKCSMFSGSGC